jgi:hypothetical protein
MQESIGRRLLVASVVVALLSGAGAPSAAASHGWTYNGKYVHWPHAGAEAQPVVVRSLSAEWSTPLNRAVAGWNRSAVLQASVVSGSLDGRSTCDYVAGRIRVCNAAYGATGWVGLTSVVWDSSGHILRARVKMNETYLKATSSGYGYLNDPTAWREVLCHELGHAFGLDHQSSTSGSCLRPRISPSFVPKPNAHDYGQLRTNYHAGRVDGTTTSAATAETAEPAEPAGHDHRHGTDLPDGADHTVRVRDLGNGETEATIVRRAPERPPAGRTG